MANGGEEHGAWEMILNNHPVEQEDLMAYLDGELSRRPGGRETLAHLERCTECQTVISDLRSVSRKLLTWEVEASSPRISQTIAEELEGFKSRLSASDVKVAQWSLRTLFDLRHRSRPKLERRHGQCNGPGRHSCGRKHSNAKTVPNG